MASNTNDLILEVKCTRETGTLQIKRAQDDGLQVAENPRFADWVNNEALEWAGG